MICEGVGGRVGQNMKHTLGGIFSFYLIWNLGVLVDKIDHCFVLFTDYNCLQDTSLAINNTGNAC